MKYPLPILAFIVFCMGCHAQSPHSFNKQNNSNSLLWEVSGNGLDTPSFLFGTFHLLCKDDLHFSDALRQAVAGSKEVYMELDMDDPSMMLQGMMYMTMKKDTTLADLYTPAEYERVKKFFSD